MEEERKSELRAVTSFVVALGILIGGFVAALTFVKNARKAEQQEAPRTVPAVAVHVVRESDHAVEITSQGAVESRRETTLAAEVGGLVLSVSSNLKRGGTVAEGEVLVTLDPADYKAALARAESALADAKLALVQEQARAEQALRDWEKIGRGEASPLVRREPQLESARARVASADAEVLRAARDVQRTEIRAPFAARVRQANVEAGSVLAPGGMVATLYSATDLEVRLPLSLEDFGFIDPQARPAVTLRGRIGGQDFTWPAEISRIDGEVDRKTLSAYVTVKILPADGPRPLPQVGLFVYATAEGNTLKNISSIPRTALLGDDRVIVVNQENRLDFRRVEVIRTTRDTALVASGIAPGDRLSITRLNAPVAGMEVTVEELPTPAAE